MFMFSSNLVMANHVNDVMQLRVMLKRQQIQIEAIEKTVPRGF